MDEETLPAMLFRTQVSDGRVRPTNLVRQSTFLNLGPPGPDPQRVYRPMNDCMNMQHRLFQVQTSNTVLFNALQAVLPIVTNWEDEINPLNDAGIEFGLIPVGVLPDLISYWGNANASGLVSTAVGNPATLNQKVVYTLVNMTIKTIFSPYRSVSNRLLRNLENLWLHWGGVQCSDLFRETVGILGTTYEEQIPVFLHLLSMMPAHGMLNVY